MADITCDCAGEIGIAQFPCDSLKYGYPSKLLLMKPDGTMTVAGESPTVAEVQTALADSGDNKAVLIEEITNGQRVENDRQEETGADTADGLTDTFAINMAITGNIKKLDEAVRTDLAELNCFSRLKVWIITNTGYIFGGANGYKCSNFIPPLTLGGFGTQPLIPISFVYFNDDTKNDPAAQDDGFLTLQNPATT